MTLKFAIQLLSAGAAIVSAGLWAWSFRVGVQASDEPDKLGMVPASITDTKTGNDWHATLRAQSRWNAWAAIAASVAAVLQGIATVMPDC